MVMRRLRGIPYHGMDPESSLQYMTSPFDDPSQILGPEHEESVAWNVDTQDMVR